jgi:glycosyltransferase involved in cell wall biosynthesis
MAKIKRVLFIEPVVAHYRRDTFKLIFSNQNFSCAILAGKEFEGVKPVGIERSVLCNYFSFTLLGHRFYYLKKSLREVKFFKPDAIVCSGVDFHHLHTILIFIWAKIHGVRFIWWSHATEGKQGRAGLLLRKLFYYYSSGVMAYSSAGLVRMHKLGIPNSKLTVVGNSMNNEDYGLNFNHINSDTFTLLFTGRITPEKKLDVLVRALAIVKSKIQCLKCIIVGGGDIEPLLRLSKELGVEKNIEFVGPVYGTNLKKYFAQSRLFVYPGGIGLSLAHALSFGLPVITTDAMHEHGPEIELLKPGINGAFFRDGDSQSLADVITEWYSMLNSNSIVISKACRDTLAEFGYYPEMVSSKIISFLNSKLG